jgi:hypothetical protein
MAPKMRLTPLDEVFRGASDIAPVCAKATLNCPVAIVTEERSSDHAV